MTDPTEYQKAVEIARTEGHITVSLLNHRLNMGVRAAAMTISRMQDELIVGEDLKVIKLNISSGFKLGQAVARRQVPNEFGTLTTPPYDTWHILKGDPVERVAWPDGSEGFYHQSELLLRP